jgi:3-deoxy-manno-octulosonate cytidylyltransferase (CMP-KDO synthetase)
LNKVAVIIPARMASTRFPGKPLVKICGKPMVQWVYERAINSVIVSDVIVATCDTEIVDAVKAFGGKAVMTSNTHTSGTDRIAEVVEYIDADLIVNVQGDEPLMESLNIELVVKALDADPQASMSSLMFSISEIEAQDPNLVKVVVNRLNRAMYFSRSPLPYQRKPLSEIPVFGHAGIYAYRKHFLSTFSKLASTPLEQSESLEQLRALEHGYIIAMSQTQTRPFGVDTPEDMQQVCRILSIE